MEQGLKERLVGAAVLVIIAVVFIPMLLDDSEDDELVITESNIPPKPDNLPEVNESDFNSRIVPLDNNGGETGDTALDKDGSKKAPAESVITAEPAPDKESTTEKAPLPAQDSVPVETAESNVGLTAWVVQLGSFESEANAEILNNKLRNAGYTSFVEPLKQSSGKVYRVRVGPELKRSDAESVRDKLEKAFELKGIVVSYP